MGWNLRHHPNHQIRHHQIFSSDPAGWCHSSLSWGRECSSAVCSSTGSLTSKFGSVCQWKCSVVYCSIICCFVLITAYCPNVKRALTEMSHSSRLHAGYWHFSVSNGFDSLALGTLYLSCVTPSHASLRHAAVSFSAFASIHLHSTILTCPIFPYWNFLPLLYF